MAYIGKEPIVGNFQKCDAITVVNGQAAYTLQVSSTNVIPESANHMLVSLNGILQAPGADNSFTVSGSTLTFDSNLATGDVIDFVILLGNVLDLGTPSDGTVTNAKLAQDIISGETALASEPADTDEFLVSDAGTLKRIDYSLIKGGGKIAQVVQTEKTDTFTTTSTSFTDITGVTVDITPAATSSKILIIASIQVGGSSTVREALKLVRDSSDIHIGDAASSRTRATIFINPQGAGVVHSASIVFLDSPSTTSATTYKIQGVVESGNELTINRSLTDSDSATYYRTPSSITAIEVSA